MRYGPYSDTAILTADGCVDSIGELAGDACCPIEPCMVDACSLMCSFISLLPNGPLWDRAKAERMSRYESSPCGPACVPPPNDCASVVDYAIYSGYTLDYLIKGPLWSALREANPDTAVETLDSWLSMLGWDNAWDTLCRDPRLGPSPFECGVFEPSLEACDANFAPIHVPTVPPALDLAVKRGIVRALSRLQMSPIKNLCGINWIIEPLGAVLRPSSLLPGVCCTDIRWEICSTGDTIEGVPPKHCANGVLSSPVQAWFPMQTLVYDNATGTCRPTGPDTLRIWPGVLAAQIIALSLMPTARNCSTFISRCIELGDMPYAAAGDFVRGIYMRDGEEIAAGAAWSLARASTAKYFDANGVYQTAAINVARFEHDPSRNDALLGITVEPTRINRLLRSTDLSVAPWTTIGTQPVTAGDPSIFGGNLQTITSTVLGGGTSDRRQIIVLPVVGGQTTASAVIKRGNDPVGMVSTHLTGPALPVIGINVAYNFDTDELTWGASPEFSFLKVTRIKYPTGEVLINITADPVGAYDTIHVIFNSRTVVGPSMQVGHVQLEQSTATDAIESSRIPTVAAQVTRSQDVLTINATGVNDWTLVLSNGETKTFDAVAGNLVLTQGMLASADTHVVSYIAA